MAKKKSRKKKKRRTPPRRHRNLISRLEKKGLLKGERIIHQPEGYEKMSEVILDFVEPYMEDATSYEAFDNLIRLAVIAWNTSMLPDDEAEFVMEEMANDREVPGTYREIAVSFIKALVERKKEKFAQYDRGILDYEITETEDGFHLSVVSFMDVDKDELEKLGQ